MAENNTSNIGFEKQIWDAACVLRGNIDASEYKSVVLGLIFLKYISDRFEAKYKELVEEGDGFEEDQDEYTAENIFFVPENARWSAIAAAAHTPEIGTVIDDAMRSIEKENKRLKDILPKNFARPELDKRRLGEVVDLFTNIQMIEHGSSKDILGRTYEYCLSKFAEQEGKLAGEFYTPSCVVRTLVEESTPSPIFDLLVILLYFIAYRKDSVFYETCRLGTTCNARCPQMASPQKGSWRQPAQGKCSVPCMIWSRP